EIKQSIAPSINGFGQPTIISRQSLLALLFRIGAEQIAEALDFDEIKFTVLKRAARELARFGQAQTKGLQFGKNGFDASRGTMDLQLGAVLAGKTVWCGKKCHQTLIKTPGLTNVAQAHLPRTG